MPGREVLLFRAAENLDLMNIVERERESSWRFRGPVTLPSQGRVHRSQNPKFYKYLDRALSKLPGRRYCSSRAALESLDLIDIVGREESSWRFRDR